MPRRPSFRIHLKARAQTERSLHTGEVVGSIPTAPTILLAVKLPRNRTRGARNVLRAITGMAWSGLRFFGLRAKTGRLADVIAALQVMAAGERRATAGQRPERRQLRRAVGGNSFFSSRSRAILPFG